MNGITKKVCNISKIAMVLSFCFQYTLTWVSIQIYPQLSRYFHKVYMFHFTLLCPVFFVHILCISENFYKQMHVIHVLFDLVCWCAKPVDVLSILSLQWRICLQSYPQYLSQIIERFSLLFIIVVRLGLFCFCCHLCGFTDSVVDLFFINCQVIKLIDCSVCLLR